jgi:hypothetical protein
MRARCAGGTGERVAREPLIRRVSCVLSTRAWSGRIGEWATPTRYAVRGPYPWDRTRTPTPAPRRSGGFFGPFTLC